MEHTAKNDNESPENYNASGWPIEYLHRACNAFSRSVERQKQIDELVRGGLEYGMALVVVDL